MKLIIFLIFVFSVSAGFKFTILSTSDLHSGFDPYYPRIAHFISNFRNTTKDPVLVLDAGDWYSGTLFKLIGMSYMFPEHLPELEFFKYCQYDATTFGNHEFDGKEDGLLTMLEKSERIGGFEFPILASNIYFDPGPCEISRFAILKTKGVRISSSILKTLVNDRNETLRVVILGIYGPNSALFSANNRKCVHFTGFNDTGSVELWDEYVDSVYRQCQEIREKDQADVIVALGHSGSPEDSRLIKDLAKRKSDGSLIDVHISSHTHEIYGHFVDGTYIFQNNAQGKELGTLKLEFMGKNARRRVRLLDNNLAVNMETYQDADETYANVVKLYKKMIDQVFLSKIKYDYDSEILHMGLPPFKDDFEFGTSLVSAIRSELNLESSKPTSTFTTQMDEVDIYFNSIACVRALPEFYHINKTIYFHEIFSMLGIGHIDTIANANNPPGDPIVHFYVKKDMINTLITATRLYSLIDFSGWFVFSDSLTFDWRWWGIPFHNMAYNVKINGKSYNEWPELIHLAAPLIIAEFIPKTNELTFGIVNLEILDKYGRVLKHNIQNEHTYYKEYLLLANYWSRIGRI